MNEQPQNPPAKTNYLRIVLFAILAYLVVALLYDRFIVRPGMETTQKELEAEIEKQNNAPQESVIIGPAEVREKIGREPIGSLEEYNGYLYEEFAIPTALPGRSHRLVAIYRKTKSTPRLEAITLFKPGPEGIDGLHEAPDHTVNVEAPTAPLETGEEGKPAKKGDAGKSQSGEEGPAAADAVKEPATESPTDTKPADKPADKTDEKDYQPAPPKTESEPKADPAPTEK